MGYFECDTHVSNSELKKVVSMVEGKVDQGNLDVIFNFGTGFHQGILEPHKNQEMTLSSKEVIMISQMRKTFWNDRLCRDFIMMADFRREHEWYRYDNGWGIPARCKMDGSSKMVSTILELKGLKVSSNKAFLEAIDRFDYDQGAAWYLDTTKIFRQCLIVAISKIDPDMLFKVLIDRDHKFYKQGIEKLKKSTSIYKTYIL